MMEYSGKKVAILGYGFEGESMYEYFARHGAEVTIVDQSENPSRPVPVGAQTILGEHALENLSQFDIISRTPPFSPKKIPRGPQVTSLTKEFFKLCPAPIIGVTGTKGKGTTSTLTAQILKEAGKTVHLVGNIGVPAMSVIDNIKPDHIVVSELSSFQLWDMDQSPHVGVVLMISEDHLDIHQDMEEYVEAKSNIVRYQKKDDIAIVHPTNSYSEEVAACAPSRVLHFLTSEAACVASGTIEIEGNTICSVNEVGLIGAHNLENITAAITAAWQYTKDTAAISKAVKEFKGLEHRIEHVKTLNDVAFYNDSYSSAPAATMAAIAAFAQPILLILGGSDKKAQYDELIHCIKQSQVKKIFIIGQTGEKIAEALNKQGLAHFEVLNDTTMKAIVENAYRESEPGDIVLLSPGHASYDMFKNFKDRGEQFKKEVQLLQ